jgi:NAD(P)-dependent dehydrogenase (short-subunit alcohol dehydrogenase family)
VRARPFRSDLELGDRGAVFVSGTSSGLGKAIALGLAARGVTVLAGVRRPGTSPASDGRPGPIHEIVFDVTSSSDVAAAAHRVRELLPDGGLRGIVNNAGVAVGGPLEFVAIDELRRQFEVNVFGQVAVTQALLELVRVHGDGRILFMSSIGGWVAAPFVGPYAASKHAVNGIADAMRRELRPWGIQVSVLAPGAVPTPIWGKVHESSKELVQRLPARAVELYGDSVEGILGYVAAAAAGRGVDAERVVRAARHALYARRARTIYLVGSEARVGVALSAALPARLFDALLARRTG